MPRKVPPFDLDDVVRRYRSGESVKQLAAAVGISEPGLYKRLKVAGVQLRSARESRLLVAANQRPKWFAEGVDLPREWCTHVVIVKLPFSVPDSPLEEARAEWITRLGKSPFVEIALPAASIRLQQAAGRLLRTVDDYGTVTILDRRLATKRWGATLMKGLPDFEVVAGLAATNAIRALDSPVPRKTASVGSPGRLMSTDVPMPGSP